MKLQNGDCVPGLGFQLPDYRRIHVAVLLWLAAASYIQSKLTLRHFEEPSGTGRFDRVTVNRETGDVYVASTSGVIFQLTEDLRLVDVYRGPSSSKRNSTVTRLLDWIPSTRIDVKREVTHQKLLLYCETDLCVVLDSSDERIRPLSRFDGIVDVPVNDSSSTNVLLFVPERQPLIVNTSAVAVLYSAMFALDDDHQSNDSDTLAALILVQETSDSFSSSLTFNWRYRAVGDGFRSGIRLRSDTKAQQMVGGRLRYIHAFDDGRFAYFVFVQPAFDGRVETRLARVCIDDDAFQSYTELVVLCRRRPTFQTYFKTAVTAAVAPMSAMLAERLGERAEYDQRALYIAMGDADDGYGICVYPLADVRHEFTQAQRDCYRGRGRILPSVDADERRCTEDREVAGRIDDEFCGSSINVGVGGRYPLAAESSAVLDTLSGHEPTSLGVVVYNNATTLLVCTAAGQLLKMLIDGTRSLPPYAVLDVGDPTVSRAPLTFDPAGRHAYALTGSRVSKIAVTSCEVYTDCETCVTTLDPLRCGWCDDRCTTEAQCAADWSNSRCPPVIYSFTPDSGPVDGGTLVTIHGRNFGGEAASVSAKLASVECSIERRNDSFMICQSGQSVGAVAHEVTISVVDRSQPPDQFDIHGSASSGPTNFAYKVPVLTSFRPVAGPRSGGVRLTVYGENLDIGSSCHIDAASRPCSIVSTSSTILTCDISSTVNQSALTEAAVDGPVVVYINNAKLVSAEVFLYGDEPVIVDVSPRVSIRSGGIVIVVRVIHVHVVHLPRLHIDVSDNGTQLTEACTVNTSLSALLCLSPCIDALDTADRPVSVRLHFEMSSDGDAGRTVQFHADFQHLGNFTYVSDPVFFPFSEADGLRRFFVDESDLILEGAELDIALTAEDYQVTVSDLPCPVVHLTRTLLSCHIDASTYVGLHRAAVRVSAGRFSTVVGYLKFVQRGYDLTATLALLPIICIVCACLLTIMLICMRKRRSCKVKQALKTPVDISYVQVAPSNDVVSSLSHWPLRQHPSPLLSPAYMQAVRLGHESTSAGQLKRTTREELRRLIYESGIVIARERLRLLNVVGQGHFGCVYRGLLTLAEQKSHSLVAVKTLRHVDDRTMSLADVQMFVDEALTMTKFDHKHVLNIVGISFDANSFPMVVLPFMLHGDLLSYIRDEHNSPTVRDLMEFGVQIANGMSYLADLKFVHRDLAARNCMLDDSMTIKVADFGLSRDIYERDYYSCDGRRSRLPVKWMAIESLEKGVFTSRSDVWSFGVVLWELMTRGIGPYPDVDNWDVINFLESGRRLSQPPYCPEALYGVMLSCWHPSAKLRPSFHQLVASVSNVVDTMQRQIESSRRAAAADYVNTADRPSTSSELDAGCTSSELDVGAVAQRPLNATCRSTTV